MLVKGGFGSAETLMFRTATSKGLTTIVKAMSALAVG
jgi:hypothetical protein